MNSVANTCDVVREALSSLVSPLVPQSFNEAVPVEEERIVTTAGIIVAERLVHPRVAVVSARLFRSNE